VQFFFPFCILPKSFMRNPSQSEADPEPHGLISRFSFVLTLTHV
jgi:hypothetical protein